MKKKKPQLITKTIRYTAIVYLAIMLILPLAALVAESFREGLFAFFENLTRPAAWHALKLTLIMASAMALVNAVMGTLTAYILTRYSFPGRSLLNSLVDIPFAIPTLVTGVMLVVLYGPMGGLGNWLKEMFDFQIVFAPPGILLALLFVGLPYVVRSVQPVLLEVDFDQEEAARTMGASSWTTFRRVLLPALRPAILGGTLLSFARALGEFGSIIVVAGNIPMRSQTASVYIMGEIESANSVGASAMSVVLMGLSFSLILVVDWLERDKSIEAGELPEEETVELATS